MCENKKPFVSIIVPVYNTENYLRECLDSILNQSLKNIEVICIDDKSSDNSLDMLKEYSEKDKRIKIIENDENKGVSITRNNGLDNANGEYLSFVDSDDKMDLDACEKLYNFAKTNDQDCILFNAFRFNDDGKVWSSELHSISVSDHIITSTNILKNNEFIYNTTVTSKFIRKTFLDDNEIRFVEDRVYEDVLFSMELFFATDYVGVYPYVNYYWRVRLNKENKSITQSYDDTTNIADRLFIIHSIFDMLYSSEKYGILINEFNNKLLKIDYRHIINQLPFIDKEIINIVINKIMPVIKNMDIEAFDDLDDLLKLKYDLLISGKLENLIYLIKYELNNKKWNVKNSELKNKNNILIEENNYLKSKIEILAEQKENLDNENDSLKEKNKNLTENNIKLKNEIKTVKSTKGWFRYKINNIHVRLKNKF